MNPFRVLANLATLGNALMGLGAIVYTLLGNSVIAVGFLVVAILFDGADGWLARRSDLPPAAFGRTLDSVADSVSFGAAPAVLIAVHHYDVSAWSPLGLWPVVVGGLFFALAISRLVYFTVRGFAHPYFVGASTPQATLAVGLALLLIARPAYLGADPTIFLGFATGMALLMVAPVRFPKVRAGETLRWPMVATTALLPVALIPIQFAPAAGTIFYVIAEVGTILAAGGLGMYFVLGPFFYQPPAAPAGAAHA